MKTTKIIIIATIITIMLICSVACAMPAHAEEEHGEFYPRLTVVVGWGKIGEGLRIVYCMDKQGEIWSFYDEEEEWDAGDVANLLMWDTGKDVETHEIIEVYYEGHLEAIDFANWLR